MVLKYISLFSGIGGFEVAIHRLFPRATCVGFSEIDSQALAVYTKKFPTHVNFGDVTKITKKILDTAIKKAGGCDVLVAGFPCNDLSSINIRGKGLEGAKSGLFYEMLRIIKIIKGLNTNLHVVIENNSSMAKKWKDAITRELEGVCGVIHTRLHDSSLMVVQKRRRLFWTTVPVPEYVGKRIQTWNNVLESNSVDINHKGLSQRKNSIVLKAMTSKSLVSVNIKGSLYKFASKDFGKYKTRWTAYGHYSDTSMQHARTIITHSTDCILIDRRGCPPGQFRIRRFTVKELARLFTFDDDHLPEGTSVNAAYVLFGKAVVVKVVEHVLKHVLR